MALTITQLAELETGILRTLQGGRIDYYLDSEIRWEAYKHGIISIYNGNYWQPITPAGHVSFLNTDYDIHGFTLSGSANYDVYARYANANTFTMELVPWIDDNTRDQGPELFDGTYVYDSATTSGKQMRFLGTVRTTTASGFVDDLSQRFIVNWDNYITKAVRAYPDSSSWALNSTTIQEVDPSNMVRGEFLSILPDRESAGISSFVKLDTVQARVDFGGAVNSTSAFSSGTFAYYESDTYADDEYTTKSCIFYSSFNLGYNYLTLVARSWDNKTLYFNYGDRGGALLYILV